MSAWRCYGAVGLNADHTAYLGKSKCYSSETAELEWQLCACEHCAPAARTCNKPCGAKPAPRGFPPAPGPPSPPLPPAPPVPSIPLFVPCENNRTGFRIPALLSVGNSTLYAFAESRTGNGDGDYAKHPCPGDNRTSIVFKTSTDGGKSWSEMTDICPDGHGDKGCLDYEAVYDEVSNALVVQYCQGVGEAHCTDMQLMSTDGGKSWSPPLPLRGALGMDDGVLVGPGRGLQLRSTAHGKAGRLLFCGHKADRISGRLSPIWASDNHGKSYSLKASLPRGTSGTLAKYGPDECQFAELSNGTIIYDARNNWASNPAVGPHRLHSFSTDGGDHWAPVSIDPVLAGSSCQGSLISTGQTLSNILFHSHPWGPGRTRMVVQRSDDAGESYPHSLEVYNGGAAYSCLSTMPPQFGGDDWLGLMFERDGSQCTTGSSCYIAFASFPARWW